MPADDREIKVGVVSDTHGLLRPEVLALLQGCDRIIHAGDVGSGEILDRLRRCAPTTAVRGNVDLAAWSQELAVAETVIWNNVTIHVVHDLKELALDPSAEGVQIVISGHSHRAHLEEKHGVTYLNPGSIGPRRFRLPVTMAWLHLPGGGGLWVEPVTLLA